MLRYFCLLFVIRPSLVNTITMPTCNKSSHLNSHNTVAGTLLNIFDIFLHLEFKTVHSVRQNILRHLRDSSMKPRFVIGFFFLSVILKYVCMGEVC